MAYMRRNIFSQLFFPALPSDVALICPVARRRKPRQALPLLPERFQHGGDSMTLRIRHSSYISTSFPPVLWLSLQPKIYSQC